jgi:hypothetical protein
MELLVSRSPQLMGGMLHHAGNAVNGDGCVVVEQSSDSKSAPHGKAATMRVEECSNNDIDN